MKRSDLHAPNAEGVTPPHDENPPTPEELSETLSALKHRIEQARRDGASSLVEHLAVAYPKVAVMMRSNEHWIAGIQALEGEQKGVPISPSKRCATICRFLFGPDIPMDAVGMSEPDGGSSLPKGKPTWKRASRRSQVFLEMMAQGVAPENAGEFLRLVKGPEALLRDAASRKRSGGQLLTAQPGTALGATADGRPITVKFVSEPEAGPMTVVRLPDDGGRLVVEINGQAEPDAAKPKPDLPPGHCCVFFQGPVRSLKMLPQFFPGGQWLRTEDGELHFAVPDAEAGKAAEDTNASPAAVPKDGKPVQKPARPVAAPLTRPTVRSRAEKYPAWTAFIERQKRALALKVQKPKLAQRSNPSRQPLPGRPALGTVVRPDFGRKK